LIDDETVKYMVQTLFAISSATMAVYVWVLDISSNQRALGALIGSELVIFAMVVYVYSKPSFRQARNSWLLAGCATAALFLLISVQLGTQ
jgi:hypothetical protein